MFDPHRDPEWVAAVRTVEVMDPGIRRGARVRRAGTILGKDVAWTTEVAGFHFPHLLELRVVEGPFAGSLIYQVGRSTAGSVARIQQVGQLDVGGLPTSMVAGPLQAALEADLRRLKAVVEQAARS